MISSTKCYFVETIISFVLFKIVCLLRVFVFFLALDRYVSDKTQTEQE